MLNILTNKEQTEKKEVDVATPAFSITKVLGTVGTGLAALLAALPPALTEKEAIVIAAFAAGTAVLLGVIALAAVDVMTRQRAREAELRYGRGSSTAEQSFHAMPKQDLILQMGPNSDEYKVRYAMVENGQVHIYADRNSTFKTLSFIESPKPE